MNIPLITSLRDSRNYTIAMENGRGICEQKRYNNSLDHRQWKPVYEWLMKEIPSKKAAISEEVFAKESKASVRLAEQSSFDFSEANLAMT